MEESESKERIKCTECGGKAYPCSTKNLSSGKISHSYMCANCDWEGEKR